LRRRLERRLRRVSKAEKRGKKRAIGKSKKGSREKKEKVMHFATEVWELPEEWFKE
jgi:hypothetical protein